MALKKDGLKNDCILIGVFFASMLFCCCNQTNMLNNKIENSSDVKYSHDTHELALKGFEMLFQDKDTLLWDLDFLEMPYYYRSIKVYKDGKPYSGHLIFKDKNPRLKIHGVVKHGLIDGCWKIYENDGGSDYLQSEFNFCSVDDTIYCNEQKMFWKERLTYKLVRLNGDFYTDSSYSDVDNHVEYVCWGYRPSRGNFSVLIKRKKFNEDGTLNEFLLKDTIHIRWYSQSLENCFLNSCELKNGLCVGIVDNKIQKLVRLSKGKNPIEIVGGFKHKLTGKQFSLDYEIYGKQEKTYVVLE